MFAKINGIELAYSDEGQGTTLVFLHGFPLSRGAWQAQLAALRGHYRVILPDLCGFGESGARTEMSMARYAEDVHTLLKQLDTGPVVLIGHSMGGYVALAFTRELAEELRGLVLVGTKAGADTAEAAAARRGTAEKVAKDGPNAVVEAMASKMLSPQNGDRGMAERVRALMSPAQPEGIIAALHAMAERPDSTGLLAGIGAPTLVVTGADDTLVPPSESDRLASGIRGARLEVIPAAGHLVAYEKPDEFNRALGGWLAATQRD